MSIEALTVILTALGLLITLGGGAAVGLAWVVRRIDAVETRLADRIDGVHSEVTEVKIAVARLEGRSQPPLIVTR